MSRDPDMMRRERAHGAFRRWPGILRRHGPAVSALALATVTVASLMPRDSVGDPGSADMLAHFAAYAAIVLPFAAGRGMAALPWALACLALSASVELLQPLVGRTGSLRDLAANAAGLAIGLAGGFVLRFFSRFGE